MLNLSFELDISSMTHLQSTELHIYSDPQNCHIALDTKDLNDIWVDSLVWCVWPILGHKRQFPACQIVNIEVRLPRPGLDTPFIAPHIDSSHKICLTVSIFSILSIFHCLKLIPVRRSVWRVKYFQFRVESGINICTVLEIGLASDHFIEVIEVVY